VQRGGVGLRESLQFQPRAGEDRRREDTCHPDGKSSNP
jgi:hypothetical protein